MLKTPALVFKLHQAYVELRISSSLGNHHTDLFIRSFVHDGALLGVPQEKEKTGHGEVKAYT